MVADRDHSHAQATGFEHHGRAGRGFIAAGADGGDADGAQMVKRARSASNPKSST